MSSPSPPAGCLSSRPGKRITTRGTNGVVGAVALHPSVVRAPPPGQAHTFTIATRRSIGHETPLLPGRLRPDDRRNSPHGHRSSTMPLTLFAFEPPSAWRRRNSGTFIAERSPASGTRRHASRAVARPDHRIAAKLGRSAPLRLGEIIVFLHNRGFLPHQPPRPPCASCPSSCASLRWGLRSGAFGVLTVGSGTSV